MKPRLVILSLPLLNKHYFFNCLDYVEALDVFSEFPRFYLGIVQHVLDDKSKDIGRALLDLETSRKTLHQL